jgi:hypothetical protein
LRKRQPSTCHLCDSRELFRRDSKGAPFHLLLRLGSSGFDLEGLDVNFWPARLIRNISEQSAFRGDPRRPFLVRFFEERFGFPLGCIKVHRPNIAPATTKLGEENYFPSVVHEQVNWSVNWSYSLVVSLSASPLLPSASCENMFAAPLTRLELNATVVTSGFHNMASKLAASPNVNRILVPRTTSYIQTSWPPTVSANWITSVVTPTVYARRTRRGIRTGGLND